MTDPIDRGAGAAASARPSLARTPLTPKRRVFVGEYLIDFNATQAAVRAGYKEHSAYAVGPRLLRVPAVKAALNAAIAARAARTNISADRVLEEYARIAFTDMRRFSEWGPEGVTLRPHTSLSDDDAAAVVEVVPVGANGNGRVKLHDKRAALDALARHLGLFGTGGDFRRYPPGTDIRTKPMLRARAALRERIEKIIAERDAPKPEDGEEPSGGE